MIYLGKGTALGKVIHTTWTKIFVILSTLSLMGLSFSPSHAQCLKEGCGVPPESQRHQYPAHGNTLKTVRPCCCATEAGVSDFLESCPSKELAPYLVAESRIETAPKAKSSPTPIDALLLRVFPSKGVMEIHVIVLKPTSVPIYLANLALLR